MSILEKILADKRIEVELRRRSVPADEIRRKADRARPPRGFLRAIRPAVDDAGFRVIAEVKKASPSKGVIRQDFDPVAIAVAYERGGAAAISVLTDEKYFQGRLEFLEEIGREVRIPILRKDFIIDSYQVDEARAAGADAILLIMGAFAETEDDLIASLARRAADLGIDVLWEVHDAAELGRLLPHRPAIVGINNRNLKTFEVSLETTRGLLPDVPPDAVTVSESGFFRREELEMMRGWGVSAFLIGESLLRAKDPGEAVAILAGPRPGRAAR